MKSSDLSYILVVDRSPLEVFNAINNVRGWWSGDLDGETNKPGDEFTYRYEDIHYSKHKITELIPGKKVVWLVLDSSLSFIQNKTEWNNTEITFDISVKDNKTEMRFTHMGLLRESECYNDCYDAWGFYINNSLLRLITTGKGDPNT